MNISSRFSYRGSSFVINKLFLSNNQQWISLDKPNVKYFAPFLRENCEEIFGTTTHQRKLLSFDQNITIIKQNKINEGLHNLKFSDGFQGTFQEYKKLKDIIEIPKQIWTTDQVSLNLEESKLNWDDLIKNSNSQSKFIELLHIQGLLKIINAPIDPEKEVLKKILGPIFGGIRETVYGGLFDVKNVVNPNNAAYSSDPIQPHTDLPFYDHPPCIQTFHCIKQAEIGGSNYFVDGFSIADQLKKMDKKLFQIMAREELLFFDRGENWHLQSKHKTIQLNSNNGSYSKIVFNERARDSWRFPASQENSALWYKGNYEFTKLVEDPKNHLICTLQPGEIIVLDNTRILHSREDFIGTRHYQSVYLDWNSLHGFWRYYNWHENKKN
jgi:gamma-butyrobetaine dioxygenase